MSLQSFPPGFGKSLIFELFPRVMSLMNGIAGIISTIMVVCLALVTIIEQKKLENFTVVAIRH